MTPFLDFLERGILPEDKTKAQQLKGKASRFFTKDGILYHRTFSSLILRCVGPNEVAYCLHEVHEGLCGDYMAEKALTYKIIRQGYYCQQFLQTPWTSLKNVSNANLFSIVLWEIPTLRSSILSPIPFTV